MLFPLWRLVLQLKKVFTFKLAWRNDHQHQGALALHIWQMLWHFSSDMKWLQFEDASLLSNLTKNPFKLYETGPDYDVDESPPACDLSLLSLVLFICSQSDSTPPNIYLFVSLSFFTNYLYILLFLPALVKLDAGCVFTHITHFWLSWTHFHRPDCLG